MATHFGKEGVVTAGGTGIGELTAYTLETTADVVEDTQLSDAAKSFEAGRTVTRKRVYAEPSTFDTLVIPTEFILITPFA